jgi:ribonuclease P protein component
LFTTLKKNWEFKRVKLEGQRYSCSAFIVEVCPPLSDEQAISRVGFVASKRLGNAIKRNYAKRRLRVLWAKVLPTLKPPRDYVLIAKPALLTNLFAQLEQDLYKVLRKIEQHEQKT